MRIVVALVTALAAIAALAGPRVDIATACSCAGIVPSRDLPNFDAAFVGTPLSHRRDAGRVSWTFEVETAVKGVLRSPLVVKAPVGGGAACGLELGEGQRAGLLVHHDGREYESGLCYQTDPSQLARYALPNARVIDTSADDGSWPWWIVALAGGGVAASALAAVGYRTRR